MVEEKWTTSQNLFSSSLVGKDLDHSLSTMGIEGGALSWGWV
jgi:hypothetical protein